MIVDQAANNTPAARTNTASGNKNGSFNCSDLKNSVTEIMSSALKKTTTDTSGIPDDSPVLEEWGFTLKQLYNLALCFFKDKEGKVLHFSYEERLKLIALTCQVSHGKFDPQTASPLGVLDVIGKDRRLAWQIIGDKSKADCMFEFITTLNKQSPLFKPFVQAHKTSTEEKLRLLKETQEQEEEKLEEYQTAKAIERQAEQERIIMEEEKRRIKDELNKQTYSQFRLYAYQQYPGNPEQQAVLVRQLQEQHYEQYMRQVQQQQLFPEENRAQQIQQNEQQEPTEARNANATANFREGSLNNGPNQGPEGAGAANQSTAGPVVEDKTDNGEDSGNQIAAASMWTRKDVKEFKDTVKAEGGEAIIRVGQGESVTIRVPTHVDGTCLFWEFATDSYDIGFGLSFEWTNADEPVSVQVTEENSSDDEEDEEIAEMHEDIEKGNENVSLKDVNKNVEIIIPVYRRDAHQEVYVGSHLFPGKGVYLMKFDNSYSFWRSKTLYYRVYYTK